MSAIIDAPTRSPSPTRVLIAEDEQHLGTILQQFLVARGFDVHLVRDGAHALELLLDESFDVALLDIVMPGLDGLEVLRLRREVTDPPEMIIITGNGSVETAISALKLGAYDYLSKPYRMAEIEALVRRAHEKRRLTRERARLLSAGVGSGDTALAMTTQFAPLRAVLSLIEQVAAGDASMLITGEPGTGKARLARVVHRLAASADSSAAPPPFAMVDCARLSGDALRSELFGVARGTRISPDGSLTRARQAGLLESVAGGTLHLAHIEKMPRELQQQLTQLLRHRRLPVGSGDRESTLPLTARVIASTTVDLSAPESRMRIDSGLLDVLTAVRVQLPPLRDRLVDLPFLVRELLRELSGDPVPSLTDDAMAWLSAQQWPGNVRELRHVLEGAVMRSRSDVIDLAGLRAVPPGDRGGTVSRESDDPRRGVLRDHDGQPLALGVLERQQIIAVLEATEWHQGEAAQQLGVSAKTLYRKIREFGLARPQDVPSRGRRPARGRAFPIEGSVT
jgi:two-component system, NtrC family, response regulator AtoC